MTDFKPTSEWQDVPDGAVLPPGLEIRMDLDAGTRRARLPPDGQPQPDRIAPKLPPEEPPKKQPLRMRRPVGPGGQPLPPPPPPPLSGRGQPTPTPKPNGSGATSPFLPLGTRTTTGYLALNRSDHVASAKFFLRDHFTSTQGEPLIHYHRDQLYRLEGSCYRPAADREIKAMIQPFLDNAIVQDEGAQQFAYQPNKTRIEEVLAALKNMRYLPDQETPPFWIGGRAAPDPKNLLCCKNGMLDLSTRRFFKLTPDLFTVNALDFDYDASAQHPQHWLKFMGDLWGSDSEAIEALQEIFGYFLTTDTRQQKIFLLIGPRRSGKGTIARVAKALLGTANVAGPTLSGLSQQPFGMEPLIGKPLAIISDARLSGRVDQHVITELLLSISGEDHTTVARKHREAWSGTLPTRFLILTNELPRLADASGALASRFILSSMTQTFYGREDHGLTERLLTELPGILNWSLEGLDRLRQRGHFRQPASSLESVAELEDLGSPIGAFVRDRCTVGVDKSVGCEALFNAWRAWCETQGRKEPGTVQTFGRDLRACVPGLKVTRPRDRDGRQIRTYEGIALG